MKSLSVLAVVVLAVMALALPASNAWAQNYSPSTTIIVYIHGFDEAGFGSTGTYGDDDAVDSGVFDVVNGVAGMLGQPTWQTSPTAANQVCGATYYGTTAPTWYTAQDIADDGALASTYVPRYALRMAKYIQHVLNRAPGATGVAVMSGSFGSDVSRYMIEHNLLNLASTKIVRWLPIVGVVRGNWAASNAPDWLAQLLGADSPDIDQMQYSWVDANVSAHDTMNTALYGPMIITQFAATHDPDNYLTGLTNKPNDATNLTSDEYFGGYTTTAALHAAVGGTLQMPGLSYQPVRHIDIVDSMGMWAGACAALTNNVRLTTLISRLKPKTSDDNFLYGAGEYVFTVTVTSPRANTLYGVTAPIQYMAYNDGVSGLQGAKKGETKYPNFNVFDQIVPTGETSVNFHVEVYELDWYPWYYGMTEISNGNNGQRASFDTAISATGNSVVTLSNGNFELDLSTTRRTVY